MAKPSSYHENTGCHNCKYYHSSTSRFYCLYGETIKKIDFDGDENDLYSTVWEDIFKNKIESRKNSEVNPYGHCDEWKRKAD